MEDSARARQSYIAVSTSTTKRVSCDVSVDGIVIASMSGGWWNREGIITFGDQIIPVANGALRADPDILVTFEVVQRFLRLTRAEIFDVRSDREFVLRQKRIWSGQLVLLENDSVVAEFAGGMFHRKYVVESKSHTPAPIILLSIWLTMVCHIFAGE